MELDPVDGVVFVLESHDGAVFGFGSDFETVREGISFDDEGVITGGCKWAC